MTQAAADISIVSPNASQFASDISRYLGVYSEIDVFSNVEECNKFFKKNGILLVEDRDNYISRLSSGLGKAYAAPIVAFSESPSPRKVVEALRAGALAYVGWPVDPDELGDALREAAQAVTTIGAGQTADAARKSNLDRLTKREREVLVNIADGLSSKDIGKKLGISDRTVEIHRANMLNRLNARNGPDAIRVAMSADGWLLRNGSTNAPEQALIAGRNSVAAARPAKKSEAKARIARLTAREREILRLVACGRSNRVIAEILEISPRTVEFHRANMLVKLGAAKSAEAVRIAIDGDLIDASSPAY